MDFEVRVFNIVWETDGAPVELPTTMTVRVEVDSSDELDDAVSDAITEATGFCHKGFEYESRRV